ncbi:hypothetical protein [Legionella waltersii]|uniref:Glycine-rich protein n=1 Tax=Legionella waltersii TaxID=66969 RepID=A0A0W1ADN0_9GAMM|nr:hypothetical protein [Legionella waltersii]KTD79445.1 hypothetical protein Lwal_1517 [Legionella waltersii]SNU97610.1 Uncharacterised protein [Legionella waltersii]
MKSIKSNAPSVMGFVLSLLVSSTSMAWYGGAVSIGWGGPNVHYHGDDIRVYNPGGYGYGGYYYNPAPVIVPNVVINVPVQRYYPRVCEEVEVCDNYTGECWLDQLCR